MSAIFRFLLTFISLMLFTCGSFQAKSTGKLAKTSDINDEFFSDSPAEKAKDEPAGDAVKKDEAVASPSVKTDLETGYAAWYGKEMQGKPTASGELFDMNKYTAAHRTYPMGSIVLIRNLENGKKKLVRINDRGPYVDGRVVDVSYAVARDLGFAEKGVAHVEVELIEKSKDNFLAKAQNGDEKINEDNNSQEKVSDKPDDTPEDGIEKLDSEEIFFADGLRPKNYTVRTGAFKVLKNAERYREELEDKYNLNAFLGKKGKFHYVWLGDFEDKDSAKKFYKKLKTDGLDVLVPKKVQ